MAADSTIVGTCTAGFGSNHKLSRSAGLRRNKKERPMNGTQGDPLWSASDRQKRTAVPCRVLSGQLKACDVIGRFIVRHHWPFNSSVIKFTNFAAVSQVKQVKMTSAVGPPIGRWHRRIFGAPFDWPRNSLNTESTSQGGKNGVFVRKRSKNVNPETGLKI